MRSLYGFLLLVFTLVLVNSCQTYKGNQSASGDGGAEETYQPEELKYYQEEYEETYQKSFQEVWEATVTSITESGCNLIKKGPPYQDDEMLYKGNITSDFCVLTIGRDSTLDVMKKYSYPKKMPFIRGGVWSTGRIQYKFFIKELDIDKTYLKLDAELSGMETNVTKEVSFWESNGILEHHMLNRIRENLGLEKIPD